MSDQSLEEVELSGLEQMEALLEGADEAEPEDEEETEQEGQDTEESEAEAEEDPAPEEKPAEETEEITWNGETKRVTKSEMRELAQKGFDYTQKTQQLAEDRRAAEAHIAQEQQSIALQNENIEVIAQVKALDAQLAQYKAVNWNQLAQDDPMQYLTLNQTYRDLKEAREAKVQEFQQKASYLQQMNEKQRQDVLAREMKALAAIPEFTGEKFAETQTKVRGYLKNEGFRDEEIDSVSDHRHIKVAWKAAQWDALQKSNVQVQKKVAEAPKVVKSGANKPQVRQADKDAHAQLKKTGRGEYAAKLIERML